MEGMAQFPDKYFELAIVDPPYFNGPDKLGYYGCDVSKTKIKRQAYKTIAVWDVPKENYYLELCRISKNQIIWGINYYNFIGVPNGRIIWDKGKNPSCTFSDGEIASCSLIETVKFFRYTWDGFIQEDMKNKEIKIHPTQKPVALYEWLLTNYANQGDKILDTHVGSASSLVACHNLGFQYVGFEIDEDYYRMASERLEAVKAQERLF
jgi:site-specific DNA-methyltransferase (adenine-specific)